jgi:hypothetical protein
MNLNVKKKNKLLYTRWKRDVLWYGDVRPDLRPSVRPSLDNDSFRSFPQW